MKEKLTTLFGGFGLVLWFILSIFFTIAPFYFIDLSFWLILLLVYAVLYIPILGELINVAIWIWALVLCINSPQELFSIIYYILFAFNTIRVALTVYLTLHNQKS